MRAATPNPYPLRVLLKRYPRHLPELYQTLLNERPSLESDMLARAIAESSLPLKVKRETLLQGYANDKLQHQLFALWALKDLDHSLFVKLLVPMLEKMPRHVLKNWDMRDGYRTCWLVEYTNDSKVWKTLDVATRKAKIPARMDVLSTVGSAEIKDALIRKRQLAFLASYLTDEELGDHRYLGRMSVRNTAAMMMAQQFNLPVSFKSKFTPAEWERLHTKVKDEWTRFRDGTK
jgi:hypothetical protein